MIKLNKSAYVIIAAAAQLFGIWTLISGKYIYVQPSVALMFYSIFAGPFILSAVFSYVKKLRVPATYMELFSVFIIVIELWTFSVRGIFTVLPLFLISAILLFMDVVESSRIWISRASIFLSALTVLVIISTVIRFFNSYPPFPMTVLSIYNDGQPAGVPLIFSNAMVIFSGNFIITMSIQFTVILLIASALLAENFIMIYGILKNYGEGIRSSISGIIVFVLGCQCESIISAVPVLSAILVSVLLLPLIVVGAFLLILSYLLLRLMKRGPSGRLSKMADRFYVRSTAIFMGILMIIEIIVSSIGVYYGLEHTIFYFYGLNLAIMATSYVLVSGVLIGGSKETRSLYPLLLIVTGMAIMVMWLLPIFETAAYSDPAYFGLMTVTSFAGGGLTGAGASRYGKIQRNIILEMISMMFTLIGVFILYFTDIFQSRLWSGFSLTSQLEFSVILILLSLPFLWFYNYLSIERKCEYVGRQPYTV